MTTKNIKTISFDGGNTTYVIQDEQARTSIGTLSNLDTTNKANLVLAINEVNTKADITIDDSLSASSENPVQNKVIYTAINAKQDSLSAGDNITISNGVISAENTEYTAGSGISIDAGVISATGNSSFVVDCPALAPVDGVVTWSVTHNLNTADIVCALYNGTKEVGKRVIISSNNTITITFTSATNVSAGDYRLIILVSGGDSSAATDSNFIPKDTVISVELDDTGDFDNLADAIEFLTGKWSNGKVIIQLGQGTFEVPDVLKLDGRKFNIPSVSIIGQGIDNTVLLCNGATQWAAGIEVNRTRADIQNLTYTKSQGTRETQYRGICGVMSDTYISNVKTVGCGEAIYADVNSTIYLAGDIQIYTSLMGIVATQGRISADFQAKFVSNNVATFCGVYYGGWVQLGGGSTYTSSNTTTKFNQSKGSITNNGYISSPF